MDDDLKITALLIQERVKGKKSRWFPWIRVFYYILKYTFHEQVLPRHPVIPFLFSEDEILAFEDPVIISRLHIQQRDSFSTYLSFVNHLSSYFFSLPVSISKRMWACSYDAYVWASAITRSRSVLDQKMIIPFMDFRNFISTDSVSFEFFKFHLQPFNQKTIQEEDLYEVNVEKNTLIIKTSRAVKKGRQVYLDYEGYGNHYYLLHHGFVAISNIYDCLLISLPKPTTTSPLLQQVLQAMGYASDFTVCYDITRFLNDKVLAYFLLKDANPTHLKQCIELYEKNNHHFDNNDIRKCALGVFTDNTKELWEDIQDDLKLQLKNHLLSLQSHYSTSIGHDNVIANDE